MSHTPSSFGLSGQETSILANDLTLMEKLLVDERRLALLRGLLQAPGHVANEQVCAIYLQHVGLRSGRDAVRAAIDHLERCGALKVDWTGTMMIVELTRRGAEAAQGLIEIDGVPRPGPECPY